MHRGIDGRNHQIAGPEALASVGGPTGPTTPTWNIARCDVHAAIFSQTTVHRSSPLRTRRRGCTRERATAAGSDDT